MRGFVQRVMDAVKKDPSIVCDRSKVTVEVGRSLEHLESLGVRKSDLKRLERQGLAVRGRMPDPTLGIGLKSKLSPHRVRWILVRD